MRPVVMYQQWSHLLFAHWQVEAAELQRTVPSSLEIDTFDGQAFVGLVPFTIPLMRGRFAPPIPLARAMHEVNVRTYVRSKSGEAGVWFFSLDATNLAAVYAARAAYHLPYQHATMSMHRDAKGWFDYRSSRRGPGPRPAELALRYRSAGAVPVPAEKGSLEHFLVERYVLFAEHRKTLYSARVHHGPYDIAPGQIDGLEENLFAAAGVTRPASPPPIVHYSPGVYVRIEWIERVRE